jgi:type II secretory pathway pseudopilin PulG
MAALLVAIAVMGIAMTVVMPTWKQLNQREKEEELVFRGQQYVRAIALFQRKYAAAYPPDIDTLVKQKFLRKKYRDPMVDDGEFEVLRLLQSGALPAGRGATGGARGPSGQSNVFTFSSQTGSSTSGVTGARGGVIGVRSKSTTESLRVYKGRTHYNEWEFVFMPTQPAPGGPLRPGMGGPRGGPGAVAPGTMGPGRGGPPRGGRGAGPGPGARS